MVGHHNHHNDGTADIENEKINGHSDQRLPDTLSISFAVDPCTIIRRGEFERQAPCWPP